ncbi:hypothetical protein N8083_01340 [Candidatus Pacebacteria bacterium]|nr:hypothetical protein [Candidatus Paceibacterota bacterium]
MAQNTSDNIERKQKSEWFIAALFFLFAGLIAPGVVSTIILTLYFAGITDYINRSVFGIIGSTLIYLSIHYTVIFVSRFVHKRYQVESTKKVARITLGYFIVFGFPWMMYEFILYAFFDLGIQSGTSQFLLIARFFVLCVFASVLYKTVIRHY